MNASIDNVRVKTLTTLASLACIGVLNVGCSAEDPGLGEPIDQTTEAVTFSPAPADQGGARWTWATHGFNLVPLGSTTNRFCFLSGLLGTFSSASDFVQVSSSGSIWSLSGAPGSGSPGAEAFCVTGVVQDGPQVDWDPSFGEAFRDLGTATNRTCFLSRVWGNLKANNEFIRVRVVSGRWRIEGNSAGGSGICVARPTNFLTDLALFDPDNTIPSPGGGIGTGSDSTSINSPWACGLTKVGGRFRSGATLRTRNLPLQTDGPWRRWFITQTPNSNILDATQSHQGTAACII